jgi:HD domain
MSTLADDVPSLPDTSLTNEVLDLVWEAENTSLANNSVRCYLWARLAADTRGLAPGAEYNEELLFTSCLLHDIGLTGPGDLGQRLEVNGADVAAGILGRHGASPQDVDAVWQAIALNTCIGIMERRGLIPALTLAGVAMDFGQGAEVVPDCCAAIYRTAPTRTGTTCSQPVGVTSPSGPPPDAAPRRPSR